MIRHIVFFKLQDPSPENLARAKEVILGMAGKVPQLRHLEVGLDVVRSERSYDLALVAHFESLDDLDAYQVHPEHVKVSQFLATVRAVPSVTVDYEVPCLDGQSLV
ncbi:MAG: Dabb family protein [Chitinophagales bacterium]